MSRGSCPRRPRSRIPAVRARIRDGLPPRLYNDSPMPRPRPTPHVRPMLPIRRLDRGIVLNGRPSYLESSQRSYPRVQTAVDQTARELARCFYSRHHSTLASATPTTSKMLNEYRSSAAQVLEENFVNAMSPSNARLPEGQEPQGQGPSCPQTTRDQQREGTRPPQVSQSGPQDLSSTQATVAEVGQKARDYKSLATCARRLRLPLQFTTSATRPQATRRSQYEQIRASRRTGWGGMLSSTAGASRTICDSISSRRPGSRWSYAVSVDQLGMRSRSHRSFRAREPRFAAR